MTKDDSLPFSSCSIADCAGNAHRLANGATGLCCAHYKRKRKTGDPLGSLRKDGEALEWLKRSFAAPTDECVAWPFSRNPQGYGYLRFNNRTQLAHRVACELAHGDPAPGMDAAHSCGKGHDGCVNPRHLRWDTRSGNFSDKLRHGTANRGERNSLAKLTRDDILRIRSLRGAVTQKQIADEYGIDPSNVSKIQTGVSWFWL